MSSAKEDTTESLKKLQDFLGDLMILGSLQGFRYFRPWVRGREELLLFVVNKDLSWQTARCPRSRIASPAEGHGVAWVPLDDRSPQSQKRILRAGNLVNWTGAMNSTPAKTPAPGCGQGDVGLPPASPCDREGADCTLFLLAGYTRYQRPYAWLRSDCQWLLASSASGGATKDIPLKLDSTTNRYRRAVQLWEMVAELVTLCTWPPPSNPFSLDMSHFESLPLTESFLASGAMTSFLHKLVIHGDREQPYHSKVVEELEALTGFTSRPCWRCRDRS
ncbi:uncharacterized protein si:dkey-19b23.7 [Pristis pectinata]|uniref:uncharacterized protein si:dkey-19b23.7 n=1 Tax=Pristis pectinata TaxID=685728 RepID=UPI00223E5FDD|nr:uncharacterized protein si:dkey-19b23.7 [Pristis pectinata]